MTQLELPPVSDWVRLTIDGVEWDVAPTYIAPVGIAEARDIAKRLGCVLPSPRMVDAIWKAADLKLEPHTRNPQDTRQDLSDEEKRAIWEDQARVIEEQIAGRPFRLLAGSHKDVVGSEYGVLGLYGWHREDGHIWQPVYVRHAITHKDYSQGLRLVRKVPMSTTPKAA